MDEYIQSIDTAPRDGSTILLKFNVRYYNRGGMNVVGTKWEECRWISDKTHAGSAPHWEPWGGRKTARTTDIIRDSDAICWMAIPECRC